MWREAPETRNQRQLRWHKQLFEDAPDALAASDLNNLFGVYGLNLAAMPQSVPLRQQCFKNQPSCGKYAGAGACVPLSRVRKKPVPVKTGMAFPVLR